ncbi:hypothetical protein SK128_001657, partial [Halocaridina rubra]
MPARIVPCGTSTELLAGVSYAIVSPGYPNAYAPFTSCQWNFFTRASPSITVDCPTFQLTPAADCSSGAFLAVDP